MRRYISYRGTLLTTAVLSDRSPASQPCVGVIPRTSACLQAGSSWTGRMARTYQPQSSPHNPIVLPRGELSDLSSPSNSRVNRLRQDVPGRLNCDTHGEQANPEETLGTISSRGVKNIALQGHRTTLASRKIAEKSHPCLGRASANAEVNANGNAPALRKTLPSAQRSDPRA